MDYQTVNRTAWNALTKTHVASEFYDVEGFKAGNCSLKEVELDLLPCVEGLEMLHLQCHFGMDTLSWARRGAIPTGVDLSPEAIATAENLCDELGLYATFICSDLFAFGDTNTKQFDVVYTSYGVLSWLKDLDRWAEIIAAALKPGGMFCMVEFHPQMWLQQGESYFSVEESGIVTMEGYTDGGGFVETIEWPHSLGEILTALLDAGLQLMSFDEYPFNPYGFMEGSAEREPGRWYRQFKGNDEPLLYSITATK